MSEKKKQVDEAVIREEEEVIPEEGEEAADAAADDAEDEGGEAAEGEEAAKESAAEDADLRYARLYAEFQNYKKRTSADGLFRYNEGKKDLASGLLEALDNFERAILSDASAGVDPKFVEGMDMIRKQIIDVLAKNGIEEIEALGEDFDPNIHQGVGTEKTSDYPAGKVSMVLQKGYIAGGRVIRPAMVKIAE
jgi:molecular chaperone GrpE